MGCGVRLIILTRVSLFWGVVHRGDRANRGDCFIWGGGGQVEFFSQDSLVLGHFPQEVRDQGGVWGSVENFDKDILVFGLGYLLGSCK